MSKSEDMSERTEKIYELRAEIRRLEAEEYAANAGNRFDDFTDAVTKTGYFRYHQDFYMAKPNTQGWLEDELYQCEVIGHIGLFCLDGGGVNLDVEPPHHFSCLEPEDIVAISKAEFEAVRVLLASVRGQVSKFISKHIDHE